MDRIRFHLSYRRWRTLGAEAPVEAATALATAGILIAAVLSFWQIGHKSLWTDEGSSVFFAQDWSNMWRQLLHRESNMWLYYILLHFWLKLGDSEAFLRAPSAVFTVVTVLALYGIGRRLVSRRAGAICTLLAATNYFLIRYAQEARGYALAVCLAAVSTYLFLLAVERRTPAFWIGYAVCAAAGIYTHFFTALVCLAQYACLPLLGRRNIPWMGATVGLATQAFLLLPLVLFEPFRNQVPWVAPPSLDSVVEFYRVAAGSWPCCSSTWRLAWEPCRSSCAGLPVTSTRRRFGVTRSRPPGPGCPCLSHSSSPGPSDLSLRTASWSSWCRVWCSWVPWASRACAARGCRRWS